jgi:alkylhydroperoxidase family enzyme
VTDPSAARLPLLSAGDAIAAGEPVGVPGLLAELNVFRTLLHHPPLARLYSEFLLWMLGQGALDARLRELVIMRLGWTTESVYEWTQHWPIALRSGLSEADVLAVRDWHGHAGFGPAERAVLQATDETVADGAISEATWRSCAEHVSSEPAVLLELVTAIGLWRMISSLLRSAAVPLEEGVAPWPPDSRVPYA